MQASRCHALWILAILALMAWPPSVAAVGEYDGVWIGTETVYVEGESPETFNSTTIIFQPDETHLYSADALLETILLERSGNQWVLPAPISTTFLGLDVVVNSMQVSFPSSSQLSGVVNLSVDAGGEWVEASATFAFSKQNCPTLSSGVPVDNVSGGEDSYRCFQIEVPQAAQKLSADTSGGTGDCDLGVFYSRPDFTFTTSEGDDNNEAVSISAPQAGRWYVFLYGFEAYSGLRLTAAYETPSIVQAAFSAAPTTGRTPLAVTFSDQSTGGVTAWSWNFGDGTASTQQNLTHVYRRPGVYTVSLTVSGPGGSDTETKTALVRVEPAKATPWIPLLLGD